MDIFWGMVIAVVALVTVLALPLFVWPRQIAERLGRAAPEIFFFQKTNQSIVSLTIDDGPDHRTTPQILDLLAEHDARATFFLITNRIPGNEQLVQRIVDEGHEIGNHMTRDWPTIKLSETELAEDLLAAHQVLSKFASIRWYRPGSGWLNEAILRAIKPFGYRCALGTVWPYDAVVPLWPVAALFLLIHTAPGAILVLHDYGLRGFCTVSTLRRVLPRFKARGLQVRTLSELEQAEVRTVPEANG